MASVSGARRRIVRDMDQDHRRLYNALTARDSRFDGVFFVGVTSTGIYCRPICPREDAEGGQLPLLRHGRRRPSRPASVRACVVVRNWRRAMRRSTMRSGLRS